MQSLIWDVCPAGVFGQIFQKAVCHLGRTGGESVCLPLTHCLCTAISMQISRSMWSNKAAQTRHKLHLTFNSLPVCAHWWYICLLSPFRKWSRPHRSQWRRSCRTLSKSEWAASVAFPLFHRILFYFSLSHQHQFSSCTQPPSSDWVTLLHVCQPLAHEKNIRGLWSFIFLVLVLCPAACSY